MERFFQELQNRKFKVPKCKNCEKHIYPPRDFCLFCSSKNLEWVEISGEGTLYAYTINAGGIQFHNETIGIVELKEGFKILTYIGKPIQELKIGQPVKLEYTEIETQEGKLTLHKFTPQN
ncbi:MAG: Zn-ribbon domain-containing OB-fold protein [Candidatus Jordarchaeum sp.]|uniref:Zn-ribbon domain-containing OB-fold protein n=1 Tax=Candidatus Jordarchaeum sp. TaxID=2823881 RepID=UPI004049844B